MTYRKPEVVFLGEASNTIQNNACITNPANKANTFTDATGGSCVSGLNAVAAYDLDE